MSKTIMKLLLIFSLMSLTACSVQIMPEEELTATITPDTETAVMVSRTPTAEVRPQPTATETFVPTATMAPTMNTTPMPTPSPSASPTPGVSLRASCPTLVDHTQPASWSTGSILFNTGTIWEGLRWWAEVEQEGVWAISAGNLQPQLAYQQAKYPVVSPDGVTLAIYRPNSEGTAPIITFHSMISGESVEAVIPPPIVGQAIEGRYPSWLPDGRVRNALQLEQILGVGQTWELYTIDPETQDVERTTLELDLPEYEFFEYDAERGWPSGFVAVDPTYQRVLYTAGDGGLEHEVRLLDLETGEILWHRSTPALVDVPPEWSEDGSSVLFRVGEPIPGTSSAWFKLISLTRDGVEEELPPQPFPQAESYVANISRSPDGRFIFYSLYSYESGRLHGYVVDTLTWEAGDVCDPDHNLFGSLPYDRVEVDWLPEGQLVYRVLIEEDGQIAHSLRVLDIPSWTAQVIFEAEPGYGVNVFGWTPVEEFP